MGSIPKFIVPALCSLALLAHPGLANATYVFTSFSYQIVNNQIVPGGTDTEVWGINNSGQIPMGIANGTQGAALVYQGGSFVPLPLPPTGLQVVPTGINNAGVIVGSAFAPDVASSTGFVLSNGSYSFLPALTGYAFNEARGINASGQIVGDTYNNTWSPPGVGYIYNPASASYTTFAVAGAQLIVASGINDAGQVVGSSYDAQLHSTPFLRQPDGTIVPFSVGAGPSAARGINNNGVITGWVEDLTLGTQSPFVGDSSGYQILTCPAIVCPNEVDALGEAINDYGQIVGDWYDGNGATYGFLATPASLPSGTTSGGAYTFYATVVANQPIFIDPLVAVGYDYAIGIGDPNFASVELPFGIGDNQYTLTVGGQSFSLAAGTWFDFLNYFPGGVADFSVTGIEPSARLDPADGQAFVTGLTFVGGGTFTGTMTPLTVNVPEPPVPLLYAAALACIAIVRRRRVVH